MLLLYGDNGPQQATGPALFRPAPFTIDGGDGYRDVAISIPGGLSLTQGDNYIALLADVPGSDAGGAYLGLDASVTHPAVDGGFNYYNNDYTLSSINSNPWDDAADFGSLAFTAIFSPAPEPGSFPLFCAGVLGLRFVRRCKG